MVPNARNDFRIYWERLHDPITITEGGFMLLVEAPAAGFVHAVTVDDALRLLAMLPGEHIRGLHAIVFRQPTRKQRILARVWGRLAYFARFGPIEGPAVILEAQPPEARRSWPRSLQPDDAEELERLRADGHVLSATRRSWIIRSSLESTRATQLFRTLPHEVGHLVQYETEVLRAKVDSDTSPDPNDAYFSKPERDRENFAHRYAREILQPRVREGRIPFGRLVDEHRMKLRGLDPAWFGIGDDDPSGSDQ